MTWDDPAFEVAIRKSSRNYGYIFWKQSQDCDAKRVLAELIGVTMWVDGRHIGEKEIGALASIGPPVSTYGYGVYADSLTVDP